MKSKLDGIYQHSCKVVAREIEGELIIVPIASGIGDMEDALFTLNETGKAVWNKLDGKKTLKNILSELVSEFDAPADEIKIDLLGITEELLKRKILVSRT